MVIKAGDECEICGQTQGKLHTHTEEYGPTEADFWASMHIICIRCHMMLHSRFRYPGRWCEYLTRVVNNGPDAVLYQPQELFTWLDTAGDVNAKVLFGDAWYCKLTLKANFRKVEM